MKARMFINADEPRDYDAAGNRLSKTAVQVGNPNPVSELSQYSYDPIYELTQAVVNGSVAESYTHDAVGNRLTSAGPTTYNYNASNELTSSSASTYTYDNNGNTTSKTTAAGTSSYTWDFENRLTSVVLPGAGGTVYFRYDPFGRRIYKSSPAGTNVYVYDGNNVIQELGGSGNPLASYTHGPGVDEPLAMYQGLATAYFQADGLGSISSLTDPTGAIAASYVCQQLADARAFATAAGTMSPLDIFEGAPYTSFRGPNNDGGYSIPDGAFNLEQFGKTKLFMDRLP
jgi:YD repeat-containing protein